MKYLVIPAGKYNFNYESGESIWSFLIINAKNQDHAEEKNIEYHKNHVIKNLNDDAFLPYIFKMVKEKNDRIEELRDFKKYGYLKGEGRFYSGLSDEAIDIIDLFLQNSDWDKDIDYDTIYKLSNDDIKEIVEYYSLYEYCYIPFKNEEFDNVTEIE